VKNALRRSKIMIGILLMEREHHTVQYARTRKKKKKKMKGKNEYLRPGLSRYSARS
jgi:hypothetical protein